MANQFDYTLLAKLMIEKIQEHMQLTLIESDSTGPAPDFPFVTYSVTSPFISVTTDIVESEVFECVVSLTVHDSSKLMVLGLANRLNKLFRQFGIRNTFKEKKIVIVSLSAVQSRDNFLTYDYERLAGFDIRFRIKDSFVDDTKESIENITLQEEETNEN